MNQYFVVKENADGRFEVAEHSLKGKPGGMGFEIFEQADRAARHSLSGKCFVVKHYTRDDFNRDYGET